MRSRVKKSCLCFQSEFDKSNRHKDKQISNLYFSTAGAHPGAGIPGVLCSAKVVENLVKIDFQLN